MQESKEAAIEEKAEPEKTDESQAEEAVVGMQLFLCVGAT